MDSNQFKMTTKAMETDNDFEVNMNMNKDVETDDGFFARRTETRDPEWEKRVANDLEIHTSAFDTFFKRPLPQRPRRLEINMDNFVVTDEGFVGKESPQKEEVVEVHENISNVEKRFQKSVASRHTSSYVMDNVVTSKNATYLEVVQLEKGESEVKSARAKKAERRAGLNKHAFAYTLDGKKIMDSNKNENMSEATPSRSSEKPRVGEQETVKQISASTQVEFEQQDYSTQTSFSDVASDMSNPDGVDLLKPYQNMTVEVKVGVNHVLTEQFAKCGYVNEGWTPLFTPEGEGMYSVSFNEKGVLPNLDRAEEVMNSLYDLNFKEVIVYGLKRIQPFTGVSSNSLDRWQVTLEHLDADPIVRERQMVRIMLVGFSFHRETQPPVRPEVKSESDGDSDQTSVKSEKPLTQRQKMRKLHNENPDTIVKSPVHGDITVDQWFKIQHQKKKNLKKKVKPEVEVKPDDKEIVRKESQDCKSEFSDDSIPSEGSGSLKARMNHRTLAKANPDKVRGQRKWAEGKGKVSDEDFAAKLKQHLKPSEQVITFSPPMEAVVERRRVPKCPIAGLPLAKWRGERVNNCTSTELEEIAKQLLRRMVRSEVRYLRSRWYGADIKERNPWLPNPEEVIKVVEANTLDNQWASFREWQKAAKEHTPKKGTETQMKWSELTPRVEQTNSAKQ